MKLVLSDGMLVKRNGGRWRPEKQYVINFLATTRAMELNGWILSLKLMLVRASYTGNGGRHEKLGGGGGEWVKLSCNGEGWLSSRTAYIFKSGGEK